MLIGKDVDSEDTAVGHGTKESFNYLAGKKIIAKYQDLGNGPNRLSIREEKLPLTTTFFEDVK
ncbi:MAG: hypothetical protein ACP5IL_06045 [Syntrophobacteraceae bacterium]